MTRFLDRTPVLAALLLTLAGCDMASEQLAAPVDADIRAELDPGVVSTNVGGNEPAVRFQADDGCLMLDADGGQLVGAVTSVTTNSNTGRINATCEAQLPSPPARTIVYKDMGCAFLVDPATILNATSSRETITPDGRAKAHCSFQPSPPDAFVAAEGQNYPAMEGVFTVPLAEVGGQVTGSLVYVGRACPTDLPLPDLTGAIALTDRGGCYFADKIGHAEDAGAIAAIVFDDVPGRDLIVAMGPSFPGETVGIPGVFVSNATGVALQSAPSATIGICVVRGKSLSCQGLFH